MEDYDVDTETVEEDTYADLRAKAESLESQLAEKSEWMLKNLTHIQTAKQFAFAAAKSSQKPPHPVQIWEAIAEKWQNAIAELGNIGEGEPGYAEAQKLLKTYGKNLKIIQTRIQIEANASAKLDNIFDRVESFAESTSAKRQTYILELHYIIKELKSIQPGTTAHADAQKLLKSAQQRLKS
ncbi:hypothetical protein [Brunnivagina elsteri]|uniref:Uncharacterized protein n=1 Tax=Brunnivagina elsteri CCALA 953 TaxID=987040 RepID=A0A2A2TL28_9CYAN|nr:hypothetical protein [Calothrix elsteri]PAX57168.1 hypothetical protein CK510_09175 [Calothrix elsteri CCALA 953]